MIYNINVMPSTEHGKLSMLVVSTENIRSAVKDLSASYELLSIRHSREIREVVVSESADKDLSNLYEVIVEQKVDNEEVESAEYVLAKDLASAMASISADKLIVAADLYTENVRFYEM